MLELTIAQKTPLTKRISEFVLVSTGTGSLPEYAPGAHIDVATAAGARSYSLINWARDTDGTYRVAVQREDDGDGGSVALHALAEGAFIQATPPKNDFALLHGGNAVLLSFSAFGQETGCGPLRRRAEGGMQARVHALLPCILTHDQGPHQGRPYAVHHVGRMGEPLEQQCALGRRRKRRDEAGL